MPLSCINPARFHAAVDSGGSALEVGQRMVSPPTLLARQLHDNNGNCYVEVFFVGPNKFSAFHSFCCNLLANTLCMYVLYWIAHHENVRMTQNQLSPIQSQFYTNLSSSDRCAKSPSIGWLEWY
jgi:hypothetical protein